MGCLHLPNDAGLSFIHLLVDIAIDLYPQSVVKGDGPE
jgi:hypothetical protein